MSGTCGRRRARCWRPRRSRRVGVRVGSRSRSRRRSRSPRTRPTSSRTSRRTVTTQRQRTASRRRSTTRRCTRWRATPSGGNGVYRYGASSSFPTASYRNTNYWVDAVFTTAPPAADVTPPTVTATTPAAGATGVATSVAPTATFSEPVQAGTISFALRDATRRPVAGHGVVQRLHRTVAVHPVGAARRPSATYTATVSGAQDTAGTPLAAPTPGRSPPPAAPTNALDGLHRAVSPRS